MGKIVYRGHRAVFVACVLMALLSALALHAAPAPARLPALQIASLPAHAPAPSPDQVVHGALDGAFVPAPSAHTPNAADARRWYRLTTDMDWHEVSPPVLYFTGATYIRLKVYAPPDYRAQELWFAQTEGIRRFSRHRLAVQLPSDLRAGQPIYVQIDSDSFTRPIRPALTDLAHYQEKDLTHVRLATLFSSVQFTMILAAACLWLVLRDRVLLYFFSYATFQLIYQMLMSGEIYELPGGRLLVPLGTHAPWLFATLSAPLSISFMLAFCDLREVVPRAARILAWMRWPFLLFVVLIWLPFAVRTNVLVNTFNVWFMASSVWALGTVMVAAARHDRQARFFLVAWMPQVLFTLLRVSQILLKLDLPPWLEYGYPSTMAFSCVIVTIGLADLSLRARHERDVAHHLADHDALTGVLNRRALVRRLHAAIIEARRQRTPLALLFLDMDHFKSVNDRYGHQAGDACLRAVAEAIADELRPSDWLGRYGGEEFVVGLPGASHDDAMRAGERIRHRIETLQVHSRGTTLQTTVSMGVATLGDHADSADELIARADAALYRAKLAGRNRIVAHAAGSAGAIVQGAPAP